MLPFLHARKNKDDQSVAIDSKGKMTDTSDQSEETHALEACAKDLSKALEAKDYSKIARVLKDIFEICEAYPHHEGEHIEE